MQTSVQLLYKLINIPRNVNLCQSTFNYLNNSIYQQNLIEMQLQQKKFFFVLVSSELQSLDFNEEKKLSQFPKTIPWTVDFLQIKFPCESNEHSEFPLNSLPQLLSTYKKTSRSRNCQRNSILYFFSILLLRLGLSIISSNICAQHISFFWSRFPALNLHANQKKFRKMIRTQFNEQLLNVNLNSLTLIIMQRWSDMTL